MNTGLTDKEKESIIKWFLANGVVYCNEDNSYEFKLFNNTFESFEEPIAKLIIRGQNNLRNNIFK